MPDPDSGHVRRGLEALGSLVSDIFLSETAELADVVLPAASWVEKDGTFTATDRRVQRFYRAIAPRGESRPDWWIVAALGERMRGALGVPADAPYAGWAYQDPREVAAELSALSPIYGGITWERLEAVSGGLQCPAPRRAPRHAVPAQGALFAGVGSVHVSSRAPAGCRRRVP